MNNYQEEDGFVFKHATKMDQGFKPLLRGLRKCLQELFQKKMGITRSKQHHMEDKEMFNNVKKFLSLSLPGKFSNEDVWGTAILIYPSLGIAKKRKMKEFSKDLNQILKLKTMLIFREAFKENNQKKVKEF